MAPIVRSQYQCPTSANPEGLWHMLWISLTVLPLLSRLRFKGLCYIHRIISNLLTQLININLSYLSFCLYVYLSTVCLSIHLSVVWSVDGYWRLYPGPSLFWANSLFLHQVQPWLSILVKSCNTIIKTETPSYSYTHSFWHTQKKNLNHTKCTAGTEILWAALEFSSQKHPSGTTAIVNPDVSRLGAPWKLTPAWKSLIQT